MRLPSATPLLHTRTTGTAEAADGASSDMAGSWAYVRAGCGNRTHDLMITSRKAVVGSDRRLPSCVG